MFMALLILCVHISLAIASLLLAGGIAVDTKRNLLSSAVNKLKYMWSSTALAVISGLILSITTGAPISSVCISAFALVSVISLTHGYLKLALQKASN